MPFAETPGARDPVDPEVEQLLIAGKKIDAIKLVRARKDFDLREAKDYVDRVAARMPPGSLPARGSLGTIGCLSVILLLILVWWLMRRS